MKGSDDGENDASVRRGYCFFTDTSMREGWVLAFRGLPVVSTLYQNFTRISPEFTGISTESHRNFTEISPVYRQNIELEHLARPSHWTVWRLCESVRVCGNACSAFAILYNIILYYIIWYYIISYYIILYRIIVYYIMSYHVILYYIMLCYIRLDLS